MPRHLAPSSLVQRQSCRPDTRGKVNDGWQWQRKNEGAGGGQMWPNIGRRISSASDERGDGASFPHHQRVMSGGVNDSAIQPFELCLMRA